MLTPPTPRVNSFSQASSSGEETVVYPQHQTESSATTTRVTPPTTASPLKYPRDSTSPEREQLDHNGITLFVNTDPRLADLLPGPPSSLYDSHGRRASSNRSPRSTSHSSESSGRQNNTIVNTIRELGYRRYLQAVNPPQFLPRRLQANPVTPETPEPVVRAPPTKKKSSQAQPHAAAKASKTVTQAQSKKRKRSEIEPTPPSRTRNQEDPVGSKAEETSSKKVKTTPPIATSPPRPGTAKPKSRKPPKKATNTGTSKPEKSRTKEQRWGDYLKGVVGAEKDVYERLPDAAVPPLGHLIDEVPVRSYTFNKGKVQDYGDGAGLHPREMELACEIGLSYNAYRQQKRMAFVGYAAMQLEGRKEFKKSHTQSVCNIDGNKATHLWVHFHDCWGWMPEDPNPPITMASLGNLQLPDLQVAQ